MYYRRSRYWGYCPPPLLTGMDKLRRLAATHPERLRPLRVIPNGRRPSLGSMIADAAKRASAQPKTKRRKPTSGCRFPERFR